MRAVAGENLALCGSPLVQGQKLNCFLLQFPWELSTESLGAVSRNKA